MPVVIHCSPAHLNTRLLHFSASRHHRQLHSRVGYSSSFCLFHHNQTLRDSNKERRLQSSRIIFCKHNVSLTANFYHIANKREFGGEVLRKFPKAFSSEPYVIHQESSPTIAGLLSFLTTYKASNFPFQRSVSNPLHSDSDA